MIYFGIAAEEEDAVSGYPAPGIYLFAYERSQLPGWVWVRSIVEISVTLTELVERPASAAWVTCAHFVGTRLALRWAATPVDTI